MPGVISVITLVFKDIKLVESAYVICLIKHTKKKQIVWMDKVFLYGSHTEDRYL